MDLLQLSHDFDYLLILDFECTCEETVQPSPQEIIEFPIVILDLNTNQILKDNFHLFVRPSLFPQLSQFCQNLTHITQSQVDHGLDIKEALSELDFWLKQTRLIESRFCFVTVGNCDLQIYLKNECQNKGIAYKSYLKRFVNLIHKFKVFLNLKYNQGLSKMLKYLNLDFLGQQHSGIDDAFNTARVAQELIRRGARFKQHDVWYADFAPKTTPQVPDILNQLPNYEFLAYNKMLSSLPKLSKPKRRNIVAGGESDSQKSIITPVVAVVDK